MDILKPLLIGAFAASVLCSTQCRTIGITVKDADGNVYHTVKIGTQVWTVENLRTTKYNDGTTIPLIMYVEQWVQITSPGYYWYNNIENKYGALYNWYAVDTKKLAPKGWHVPTDAEWDTLQAYLIANGYNWDGTTEGNKVAKSMAAKMDWRTDTVSGAIGNDLTKNNKSGFLALPGGFRANNGEFVGVGSAGFWWGASESDTAGTYSCALGYDIHALGRFHSVGNSGKSCGFSIRLLRD